MKHRIDVKYPDLRQDIRDMTLRTGLYRLLKDELSIKGYWKLKARGKPDIRNMLK